MNSYRSSLLIGVIAGTVLLAPLDGPVRALWPAATALMVILATRRALFGLLAGGFAGAVLLHGGDPWQAYLAVFRDHLAPSLASFWKVGAIALTLVLGGFAGVVDRGGGFEALLGRLARPGQDASRRFQYAATGLGLLCFFDGLANSMTVGRVGRSLANRCGVSRVKLAYIVDSTSSAVACVALVSTWIAFQLSMIEEGFRLAGRSVNPYAEFLQSLPYNFHCWFTLLFLVAAARWRFDPGPMRAFEDRARAAASASTDLQTTRGRPAAALVPLAVLMVTFVGGFVVLGSPRPIWPLDRTKLVAAFGSDAGPLVMVLAGLIATLAAVIMLRGGPTTRLRDGGRAFSSGVLAMVGPIFVLIAAWILSSVSQALGTAELLASLIAGAQVAFLAPLVTFAVGALVSFATGTSWGTMGLLFPLAIPAAAQMAPAGESALLHAVVAAVFSGAVFGDHCSPFSDTTIVTAIACEVEPHDHVRTQLPYALICAAVAAGLGFLPAGFGVPPGWSLLAGGIVLALVARYRGSQPGSPSPTASPRGPSGSGGPAG